MPTAGDWNGISPLVFSSVNLTVAVPVPFAKLPPVGVKSIVAWQPVGLALRGPLLG